MDSEEKIIMENKDYKQVEITKTRFYCKRCKDKKFNRLEHIKQHLAAKHNMGER